MTLPATYGLEVQQIYLELFLSDAETFVICQSIFDHTLFDKKLQAPAEFIYNFVNDHSTIPTFEIVNAATGSNLEPLSDIKQAYFDWVIEQFEIFTRHKSLEKAIIESAELLESGEYGLVEDKIKTAVQIGLNRDLGLNYYQDPRTRLMRIRDTNGQMSTGWTKLDKYLYGGMNRGELSIFCAQSGGGKSLFLANLALNWSFQGLNVVYVSLELAEDLVAMRMDAMITGVETKNIFKNIDDVELQVVMHGKKNGSLQIKYIPSGKTCNDLRSYLKEYEVRYGKKVDILAVDYLDLLHPVRAKISAENLFIKDKYVSEELRVLAAEKKCVVITASQLNRSSIDEVVFNHAHISGGISKIQTADNVFAINSSHALKDHGKYQLQLLKTRNSSGVGKNLTLKYDVSTMRITDDDSDDDDDDAPVISTSQLYLNNLTKSSEVTPNVEEQTFIKPSKVEMNTAKLRQMTFSRNNTEQPAVKAATVGKYDIIESDDDHF